MDQELDRQDPEVAPSSQVVATSSSELIPNCSDEPITSTTALPMDPSFIPQTATAEDTRLFGAESGTTPCTTSEAEQDTASATLDVTEFATSQTPAQLEPPQVDPVPFVVSRAQGDEERSWNGTEGAAHDTEEVEDHPRATSAAAAGGPNLMLALVCWVASATSLFEAFALYRAQLLHTYAFTGYFALGLGVLLFSVEALAWARSVRRWLGWLYLPAAALTILGVVSLILSHAPGRRI